MKLASLSLATALLAATGAPALEPQPAAQRNCQVVDLRDAKGEVKFDLFGTVLLPTAAGEARIEIEIKKAEAPLVLKVKGLVPPSQFREEYLTYVAWRVLESGSFISLGELRRDGDGAGLTANVPRGVFGLLVTAEPYFAVPRPSDAMVLEARPTVKAAKRLRPVEVACELLPRDHYSMGRSQESLELLFASEAKTPPELLQARNAVDIAKLAGAEQYAKDRLDEATRRLLQANALLRDKGAPKQAAGAAFEAVVTAELARQIALQRAVDQAAMIREVESARREAKTAAAELETARIEGKFEAERRQAVEQRLKDEVTLREAIERRREAERTTPAPALRPEERAVEQERQVVQAEIERMRSELDAERERMLGEVVAQVQTQAELERARMQVVFAEERAELRVERARLEAQQQILEARQQRPEPAAAPAAEPVPLEEPAAEQAPVPAVAPESLDTARSAEWQRLSSEITAARDALVVEQTELRALREELRMELDAARQPETAVLAETPAEAVAEAPEPEPAKKRRWWFGRKKAEPENPPPAGPVRTVESESDLDKEWRWIQAEQARLDAERAEMEAQRRELAAKSEQMQSQERRWWFGRKKNGTTIEPVVVQDPAVAIELSRLEAERSRMTAEAETAKTELAAERAELEAERGLRKAEQEAEQKGQRIEELNRRVAELESTAAGGEPVAETQAELSASIEQLRAELAEIKAQGEEPLSIDPGIEQPAAWRSDLAELLGAERTPRGLVVRMADLSFETGQHELRPEAREQLARVAGILHAAPGARIEIEGHTDSTGDPALNQRLSESRAAAVMGYLATMNVPVAAMSARGLGDTKPAASNETREGRSRNRRVELIVTRDGDLTAANGGRGHEYE